MWRNLKSSITGREVDALDPTQPRSGDTLVQLSTDSDLPLEDRMDLLGYSFAKIVQGAVLRQVTKWDLRNGCIEFIVGGGAATPGPRGHVKVSLDDIPTEVHTETHNIVK